jgi:ankyrin repeat protein
MVPLHAAALNGHLEICSLLLDRGAEVGTKDNVSISDILPFIQHDVYFFLCMRSVGTANRYFLSFHTRNNRMNVGYKLNDMIKTKCYAKGLKIR